MKQIHPLTKRLVCAFAMVLLMATANAAPRQVLYGHVPAAALQLRPERRLSSITRMNLSIALPLRNQDALTNLLQQIYDPASTNYHQFLTPDQFSARFGPTAEDYQALVAFALTNGLNVTEQFEDRTLLHVSGTVPQVESIFQVTIQEYRHPRESRMFFAPDKEPSLNLAVPVLRINGLDNYNIPEPGSRLQTPSQKTNFAPGGGSGAAGDYIGNDFRNAYVPGSPLNGSGQAVGLLELDGYYVKDITNYEATAGLAQVTLQNVLVDGFSGTPTTNGIYVAEVSLDIEVAIAMAPGLSKVIVYEAANNGSTFVDILHRMASDNAAKQLSCSWFIFNNPSADQYYLQFAAQGQSFFQCSGDDGAFFSGIPQYADNPNVTLAGGTSLTTTGPGGSYVSEQAWNNNDGTNGGGGGISLTYTIPNWQKGFNSTANHGSGAKRNIPDIAMVAQNVRVFYNNGSVGTFWGTSISAPLWAGYTSLINQRATADGRPSMGFLNPALYALGRTTSYSSLFHDVTTGNNTNRSSTTLYSAVAGFDLCTGLGTPTLDLIPALENFAGAVWVDFSVAGPGSGTFDDPYNTLALGIANVASRGTVAIKGPSSTLFTTTITKPLTLNASGGRVIIGQ
jgi:subtilase family serine protease